MEGVKTITGTQTLTPAAEKAAQKKDGEQTMVPLFYQPKLTIGSPDDPLEKEADDMADKVMRMEMPSPINFSSAKDTINRKCAHCEEEENQLQRKESGGEPVSVAQSNVHDVINSSRGSSLDTSTRSFMEPRFNYDFSNVKIHDGDLAAKSAGSINALAYTSGTNVVFNSEQYNTSSDSGKRLLAHELTHVVQQGSGSSFPYNKQLIQRKVVDKNVSCHKKGLHGGVPGGILSGVDAVAIVKNADERAKAMAEDVQTRLHDKLTTFGTSSYTADAVLDAALAARFGLSIATPADHAKIRILEREFRAIVKLLGRNIYYVCRDAGCDPGDWAFTFSGQHTIHLCGPFWRSGSTLNQRGSTILHEAIHLWWDQVDDWGNKPLHNAHCFEQLALDIAGATGEILPEFAGACVV